MLNLSLVSSLCPTRAHPSPASDLRGLLTVPQGPPQLNPTLFHGSFYFIQTRLLPPSPAPSTCMVCSGSEHLLAGPSSSKILSSNIQFKDRRAHLARLCQLTAGASGKPNLILGAFHSGCSSPVQAAVQPRTWVCGCENKPEGPVEHAPSSGLRPGWQTDMGSRDTQMVWHLASAMPSLRVPQTLCREVRIRGSGLNGLDNATLIAFLSPALSASHMSLLGCKFPGPTASSWT